LKFKLLIKLRSIQAVKFAVIKPLLHAWNLITEQCELNIFR